MTFTARLGFKLTAILAVIFLLFLLGILYTRYEVKQWLQEQNATIEVSSWRPSLNALTSPSLVIGKTIIQFKNPQTSLEKIEFSKATINLNILSALKHFLFTATFPVKIGNLKVSFKDQTYMKSEQIEGKIVRKRNFYELDNIVVKSFQFGVLQYQQENSPYKLVHLVLYRIEGKVTYETKSQLINLLLEVPEALWQMPEGKDYSVKAEGELQLLEQKDVVVPVQGRINLEIKRLLNFLSHFHPMGLISSVEKNLDTVLGRSSSIENFSSPHTNEEKGVTIKVKFQPNAIYFGPLKVYP